MEERQPSPSTPKELERRTEQAHELVNKHVLLASGASAIPLPVVDVLAVAGVNLRLLKQLAEHYGTPFSENVGKSLLSSLLGSISGSYLGRYAVNSLLKGVPVLGFVARLVSTPLASAAVTLAVGRIFIQHFETGGTLLTFDARKMRKHFQQEFERSRAQAAPSTPPAPPPASA